MEKVASFYCLKASPVSADHIHMSAVSHSILVDRFPGQYLTQSRGDVIIKVFLLFLLFADEKFQGKGVMETFWVQGKLNDGSSVVSSQNSPRSRNIRAAQLSPQSSKDSGLERKSETRSVDDYDVETIHTEPLYRHYSRQTTVKLNDH